MRSRALLALSASLENARRVIRRCCGGRGLRRPARGTAARGRRPRGAGVTSARRSRAAARARWRGCSMMTAGVYIQFCVPMNGSTNHVFQPFSSDVSTHFWWAAPGSARRTQNGRPRDPRVSSTRCPDDVLRQSLFKSPNNSMRTGTSTSARPHASREAVGRQRGAPASAPHALALACHIQA